MEGLKTIHWITLLGAAVFLAVFYWQRFNSWTLKEISDFDNANLSPPRYFTKWSSFLMYGTIYVCIVEVAYLLLIELFQTPPLVQSFHAYFGIGEMNESTLSRLASFNNSVLVSLWILTGVVPIFPGVSKAELYLRERLHEKALIPEEANSVVEDLQLHETRFHPIRGDAAAALETGFMKQYGRFSLEDSSPSPTVRHKWFKLIYLYYKLREWAEGMRAMRCASPAYKVFSDELEKTRLDVQQYLAQLESGQGDGQGASDDLYLQRLELDIDGKISELLVSIYRFISCAVYATERWPQGTRRAFSRFGLTPRLEIHVPLDWDTLLESGAVVLVSTLLPTLIYFFALHKSFPTSDLLPVSTLHALSWAILSVFAHGLAIIAALVVYRVATRQSKPDSRFQGNVTPSTTRIFLTGCAGYTVGLLTFTAYALLDSTRPPVALEISMWALLPATTAAFIGYHLDNYVYAVRSRYGRIAGAMRQGAVTMLISILIVVLLQRRYFGQPEFIYFVGFVALISALIGTGIGYTFPGGYKRNLRGYAGEDRRKTKRISGKSAPQGAQLCIGDEEYATRLVDLSRHGAALDSAETPDPDATVDLSIPDIAGLGNIKGMLVRQGGDRSFFRFLPDQKVLDKIEAYVAEHVAGKGLPV